MSRSASKPRVARAACARGALRVAGVCLALVLALPAAHAASGLRAGAAVVAMDVPQGTPLAGYGGVGARFSTGELDATQARALVLEEGALRVAIATLDTVIVRPRIRDAVLERVAGLDLDGVMLVATHTHSGPGGFLAGWIPSHVAGGGAYDVRHEARLANAAGDAIRTAAGALVPVRASVTRGACALAHNRRHAGGPAETELPVISLVREDGAPLALLFSYGVHAVALGPSSTRSSADLAGEARRVLDARFGTALFLPGPLGDQNPLPGGLSPWAESVAEQESTMRALGAKLAACVASALAPAIAGESGNAAAFTRESSTAAASARESSTSAGIAGEGAVPARSATEPVTASGHDAAPALRFVEEWATPPAFAPRAGGLVWLASWVAPATIDAFFSKRVPIQALELAGARFVALPVEPAHALGEAIRAATAPGRTPIVVAHANDWLGYALDHDDFETGGYEANLSPFGAVAGAWAVERATRVLRALDGARVEASATGAAAGASGN